MIEDEELEPKMLAEFERVFNLVESDFQKCIAWKGDHRKPSHRKAQIPSLSLFTWKGTTYTASLVAHALFNRTPYVIGFFRMRCRNIWCVNPGHIDFEGKNTGRRKLPLEETQDYNPRKEFVLKALRKNPTARKSEIYLALKEAGMGGKNATINAIVGECRQELGLAARIPSRGKEYFESLESRIEDLVRENPAISVVAAKELVGGRKQEVSTLLEKARQKLASSLTP